MKKVAISPCENLLNLYWLMEFLSRKGIKVYPYKRLINSNYETIGYEKITNPDKDDWNCESWCRIELLSEDYGEKWSEEELDKLSDKVVYHFDYLENREDKDLIDIANKINNEKKIKIFEIPDDVSYHIEECECAIGEKIVENHREWY